MKKTNRKARRFLIFMFSITAAFGFIAVDVVHSSKPISVQADTAWGP